MGQDASTTANKVVGGIVGFIFPIIGLILFFVWRKNKPSAAKVSIIAAAISFVINLIVVGMGGAFGA